VRAWLRDSLRHALTATDTSRSEACKWLKVDAATLRRWLSTEAGTVSVAAVLRSPSLSKHFIRCLASLERRSRRRP
jgi:hypothetical protein